MKHVVLTMLAVLTTSLALAQTTTTSSEAFWGGVLPLSVTEQQALLSGQVAGADQVTLRQNGAGNQAYYRSGGANQGNRVVLNQDGDGNLLSLSLKGSQNTYLLDQQGNSNTMQLNDIQGDRLNVQVRQAGSGNQLQLASDAFSGISSTTAGPIRIEQTGGARATITSTYFQQQ